MAWKIEFDKSAEKELKKLDKTAAIRILKFMKERISQSEDPRSIGEALRGSALGNYWKYRVGDYRIIVKIEDGIMKILVVKVGNRREVYKSR